MTMTLASSIDAGLSRTPRAASAAISADGLRLEDGDLRGIEPEREPAFQHRAAHLAGADQHERAGEVAEVNQHGSHRHSGAPSQRASPESITTAGSDMHGGAHRIRVAMDARLARLSRRPG